MARSACQAIKSALQGLLHRDFTVEANDLITPHSHWRERGESNPLTHEPQSCPAPFGFNPIFISTVLSKTLQPRQAGREVRRGRTLLLDLLSSRGRHRTYKNFRVRAGRVYQFPHPGIKPLRRDSNPVITLDKRAS